MNSRRMFPGADTNAIRRFPNAPSTTAGPQTHVVAFELAVEVVGEQRGVEESFRRQLDAVLVDRTREQCDHHGSEVHVGAFAVVPVHPVAYLGARPFVEGARGVEVTHLHRDVRHAGNRHPRPPFRPTVQISSRISAQPPSRGEPTTWSASRTRSAIAVDGNDRDRGAREQLAVVRTVADREHARPDRDRRVRSTPSRRTTSRGRVVSRCTSVRRTDRGRPRGSPPCRPARARARRGARGRGGP